MRATPARPTRPAWARSASPRSSKQHGYSGGKPPAELLRRLRDAPASRAGDTEHHARRHIVVALVTALQAIVASITDLTRRIADAVRAHPDGPIFLSFFRSSTSVICAATLLAEIGDDRGRYPTPDALAADAGMSPVAIESGKHKHAGFRYGCDKRLRAATATLADSTRHWHPWAHDTYHRARTRGHDHQRAIRGLGRNWTRILWRCWQDHTPYNPTLHGALNHMQS